MRAFGTLVFFGLLAIAAAQTTDGGAETSNPETTQSPENPTTDGGAETSNPETTISPEIPTTDGGAETSNPETTQSPVNPTTDGGAETSNPETTNSPENPTTDGGAETSNPETTKSPENPTTPAPKPKKKRCGKINMKKLDTDKDGFISFEEVMAPFSNDPESMDTPKFYITLATFYTMDVKPDDDTEADMMVDQAEIDAFLDVQGCGRKERRMFRKIYRAVKRIQGDNGITTDDKEEYLAGVDPDYLEFAKSMVALLET